jgi:hypothetical protein
MISTCTIQSPLGTSELSTTDNMSSPLHPSTSSSRVEQILDAALSESKKETGTGLLDNWLAQELETCDSVEAVLDIIQHQAEGFDKFRAGDKRLMKWIGPSVRVLDKISSTLGEGIGMVRTINP